MFLLFYSKCSKLMLKYDILSLIHLKCKTSQLTFFFNQLGASFDAGLSRYTYFKICLWLSCSRSIDWVSLLFFFLNLFVEACFCVRFTLLYWQVWRGDLTWERFRRGNILARILHLIQVKPQTLKHLHGSLGNFGLVWNCYSWKSWGIKILGWFSGREKITNLLFHKKV